MGTINVLKSKTKGTRYKAIIQIRRQAQGINYLDTRTFGTRALAKEWIRKEEARLEENPELLMSGKQSSVVTKGITLSQAITQYLDEVTGFGRSKASTMRLIARLPIGKKVLITLSRQDYADYANARREGKYSEYDLGAVQPATINMDLQYIRTILNHAELIWGLNVRIEELEKAMKGLRKARVIGDTTDRFRLPTSAELQRLTTTAYSDFYMTRYSDLPVHLVMWFTIYTGRRLSELTRLKLDNYDREHQRWLLEDVKHPDGTAGNDKYFVVDERAEKIVDLLLDQTMRQRMLKRGGNDNVLIPFATESIDRQFQKIKRLAKVKDLHFHDFRHEAATRLAEKGLGIPQIQQYTLHEDWNSLKIYVNLNTIRKKLLDFDEAMENTKNTKLDALI